MLIVVAPKLPRLRNSDKSSSEVLSRLDLLKKQYLALKFCRGKNDLSQPRGLVSLQHQVARLRQDQRFYSLWVTKNETMQHFVIIKTFPWHALYRIFWRILSYIVSYNWVFSSDGFWAVCQNSLVALSSNGVTDKKSSWILIYKNTDTGIYTDNGFVIKTKWN